MALFTGPLRAASRRRLVLRGIVALLGVAATGGPAAAAANLVVQVTGPTKGWVWGASREYGVFITNPDDNPAEGVAISALSLPAELVFDGFEGCTPAVEPRPENPFGLPCLLDATTWTQPGEIRAKGFTSVGLYLRYPLPDAPTCPADGAAVGAIAAEVSSSTDSTPEAASFPPVPILPSTDLELLGSSTTPIPQRMDPGDELTVDLTVANRGPCTAAGVLVENSFPKYVFKLSVASGGGAACDLKRQRCTYAVPPSPGEERALHWTVRAGPLQEGLTQGSIPVQADARTSDGTAEEAETIEDYDSFNNVWASSVWMSQSQSACGTAGGGGLAAGVAALAFLVVGRRRERSDKRSPPAG
jgi:hypothetical protein